MNPLISETVDALRQAGWVVEVAAAARPLPPEVAGRHPGLPALALEFITSLDRCERGDVRGGRGEGGCWLFTSSDYAGREDDPYPWDRIERIFTEAGPPIEGVRRAAPDPDEAERARLFWDRHLPILHYGVGELEYLAVVSAAGAPDHGRIVHGFAIDYDEPSEIAPDFGHFLEQLRDIALAPPTGALFRQNYLALFVHDRLVDDGSSPPGAKKGLLARIGRWFGR